LSLDDYNAKYKDSDPDFDGGVVSMPILATESFSWRTTSEMFLQSTEIGIAPSFVAQDGVSANDWKLWTSALTSITLKTPFVAGYVKIDAAKYQQSRQKTQRLQ
jgi:hypothetical protein